MAGRPPPAGHARRVTTPRPSHRPLEAGSRRPADAHAALAWPSRSTTGDGAVDAGTDTTSLGPRRATFPQELATARGVAPRLSPRQRLLEPREPRIPMVHTRPTPIIVRACATSWSTSRWSVLLLAAAVLERFPRRRPSRRRAVAGRTFHTDYVRGGARGARAAAGGRRSSSATTTSSLTGGYEYAGAIDRQ